MDKQVNEKIQFPPPPSDRGRWFSTPDIYQVAFYLVRGHQISSITHCRRRNHFWFERTEAFATDLADFSTNANVPIRDWISALYRAKRLMDATPRDSQNDRGFSWAANRNASSR
jgi:hypothetical protein